MYYRERETNPRAAADHNKRQRANAKDRLKTVAAKIKAGKKDKA
jgi:hypothetical protein